MIIEKETFIYRKWLKRFLFKDSSSSLENSWKQIWVPSLETVHLFRCFSFQAAVW